MEQGAADLDGVEGRHALQVAGVRVHDGDARDDVCLRRKRADTDVSPIMNPTDSIGNGD